MEMDSTCTLMQQNKKLKKDVDFPIEKQGTSHEKLMSKMHKFNSTNTRISGRTILKFNSVKRYCSDVRNGWLPLNDEDEMNWKLGRVKNAYKRSNYVVLTFIV
ncbi:hypothetical protein NC653_037798 [Populus alba x Populus x berolinensis]|uniref:Uncharacterized protein n=1 Tax=Populus alba x Populus x berolinensis TaxID=444605 RepID=A0AAD6PSL1_9ROSI|nr:hypothetical protein NC653_037798 [Populus alba x Populus x berolinensis]